MLEWKYWLVGYSSKDIHYSSLVDVVVGAIT